jgi:hypothetical protein
MASSNIALINDEIIENFSGLFQRYNDRVLADDSLSDLNVLLLSMYLADLKSKKSGSKYDEVREIFISLGRKERPNFNVAVHNAKKQNLIEFKEKDRIFLFLVGGLKHLRKILGDVGKSPVYIIKSGQSITAIKLFEEFLVSQFKGGEILVCDSHISYSTLLPFTILKDKITSLKLLTSNIYDPDKFNDYKNKMSKELNIPIEVKTSFKIHDRYIIFGDECWSIGCSIKDLGNKDTMVREVSDVTSSMKELFSERWDEPKS